MVFHNQALMKIIESKSEKDLHAFIGKPAFINREHDRKMSLLTVAQSRYSDLILS